MSECEHTLAKIIPLNFIVDCWACPPLLEYTFAVVWFEAIRLTIYRSMYLIFILFLIALSHSRMDNVTSLNRGVLKMT